MDDLKHLASPERRNECLTIRWRIRINEGQDLEQIENDDLLTPGTRWAWCENVCPATGTACDDNGFPVNESIPSDAITDDLGEVTCLKCLARHLERRNKVG